MHHVRKRLGVLVLVAAAFAAAATAPAAEDTSDTAMEDAKRLFDEVMQEQTKGITIKESTKDEADK